MAMNRDDLIVDYFRYLVDEYGYHVEDKRFDPQVMGNAYVVFKSPRIGIQIVIDRNQVLLSLGDQTQPMTKWYEFLDVLTYFAPGETAYDFGKKTDENTWDDVVQAQLVRLASILRSYCDPILRGNLEMSADIEKLQASRGAKMLAHLRSLSRTHRESRPKQSD
jgi:hypothetical protein